MHRRESKQWCLGGNFRNDGGSPHASEDNCSELVPRKLNHPPQAYTARNEVYMTSQVGTPNSPKNWTAHISWFGGWVWKAHLNYSLGCMTPRKWLLSVPELHIFSLYLREQIWPQASPSEIFTNKEPKLNSLSGFHAISLLQMEFLVTVLCQNLKATCERRKTTLSQCPVLSTRDQLCSNAVNLTSCFPV